MRNNSASSIALGGVFAALAVIIMSLGGLIPVATYICPLLCAILLQTVLRICGKRIAWAWFGAVSILGVLLSPDKEAAATFLFLGYYPIIKTRFDKCKFSAITKLLYFNITVFIMYWLLLKIIGLPELTSEFQELGIIMLVILMLLGNLAFYLLDRVLNMDFFGKLGKSGK